MKSFEIIQIEEGYIKLQCSEWLEVSDYMANMNTSTADQLMAALANEDHGLIGYILSTGFREHIKNSHKSIIDDLVGEKAIELENEARKFA
jgi:hypothetical protein